MVVLGNVVFWLTFFMIGFVASVQIVKDFGSRFVMRLLHVHVRASVLTFLFVVALLIAVRTLRVTGITTSWTANAVRNGVLIYTATRMHDHRLFGWFVGAVILIFWPVGGPYGWPFIAFVSLILLLIPLNLYSEWVMARLSRRVGVLAAIGAAYWLFDWWISGYDFGKVVIVYVMFVLIVMLASGYDQLLNYRREQMDTLKYDTQHDALTGAGSRNKFVADFTRFRRLVTRGTMPAVHLVMIDIDHFKQINDTYGHLAGDTVLTAFVHDLNDFLTTTDYPATLYRTGGEEFSLIVAGGATDDMVCATMNAYRERLRHLTVHVDGTDIQITVSVGVSAVGVGDAENAAVIARADAYLYAAKRAGRNNVVVGD